jgi:hypothetical protein
MENEMNPENEIKELIYQYIKAYLVADTETLGPLFHHETNLLAVSNGKLAKTTMTDWLSKLDERRKNNDIRTADLKIETIDVTNNTANSKIVITSSTSIITDYLTFLNLDNNWLIVSKIYDLKML